MHDLRFLLLLFSFVFTLPILGQQSLDVKKKKNTGDSYLLSLDDAKLDLGFKVVNVFALDDRAPLSSNPHFQAMWNLIRLGASLEALLQGLDEPMNDVDLTREFGQNGYNKTLFMLFMQYGFGESSDVELQKHFFEFAVSSGYFKEGNGGLHTHFDYRMNILKTNYGAGVNSISRFFDYEVYLGARVGFDWSSARSEGEAGFFTHLSEEIQRIADENEFTASQLITLEKLADESKILMPGDVGGTAFHAGPIGGARISTKLFGNATLFMEGMGFYDLTDLNLNNSSEKENKRSQHHLAFSLGLLVTIGGEGRSIVGNGGINFF